MDGDDDADDSNFPMTIMKVKLEMIMVKVYIISMIILFEG